MSARAWVARKNGQWSAEAKAARAAAKGRRVRRFVRANADKPHRCPGCHGIPQVIYDDRKGGARLWRTYACDRGCAVRWWRGWSS